MQDEATAKVFNAPSRKLKALDCTPSTALPADLKGSTFPDFAIAVFPIPLVLITDNWFLCG